MEYLRKNFLSVITLILLACVIAAGAIHYRSDADAACSCAEENSDQNIVQNVTNNTIEIIENGSSVSYAASKGLRSALSVYCTFTTTVGGNSPWNPYPTQQTYYSTGSGVIYELDESGNAFVITNYHVVYDSSSNTDNHISDKIYLYLYGLESEEYAIEAKYVGGSPNYDIAILRVDGSNVLADAYASGAACAVDIADSDEISVGETAIAIGNPSSSDLNGLSVTKGIVNVDSEYITMTSASGSGEVSYRVIRVDTPINSGNSGGGLYNGSGELIGIVNAKISSSDIENIGYAIPSNIVRAVADNIIDYCFEKECEGVMRCILGITVGIESLSTDYDEETGRFIKSESIYIAEVSKDSLAESKLENGDVIISVTIGERQCEITRQHHIIDAMLDARVGDEILFETTRNGLKITVSITVTEDCLTEY